MDAGLWPQAGQIQPSASNSVRQCMQSFISVRRRLRARGIILAAQAVHRPYFATYVMPKSGNTSKAATVLDRLASLPLRCKKPSLENGRQPGPQPGNG